MAEYTLGEAYSNQGVYRNPQSSFGAFAQGLQTGELLKQRKEAKDAKINELISKNTQVDPEKFIPALYGKAKEETIKYLQSAQELRSKYGDRRFLYTPEHQQLRANYDYQIANLSEESARAKELQKGAQMGQIKVDPNYLKRINGTYEDYTSYKNPLTGQYVDPTTARGNIQGFKGADINELKRQYFGQTNLYSEKGKNIGLSGGEGLYQFHIPEAQIKADALTLASDPSVYSTIILDRGEEVKKKMMQIAKAAEASGQPIAPEKAAQAAAAEILAEDFMSDRLSRSIPQKYSIAQKTSSDNGGNGTATQNVGEIINGSLTVALPTYDDQTGKETENGTKFEVATQRFSATPVSAGVALSQNVYDYTTGKRVTDLEVQNAKYGDYQIVPVYKQGTKGTKGNDLSGRIVDVNKLNNFQKKSVEYVPMAFGSYDGGSVYRPMADVEGSAMATESATDKKALQQRFAKLREIAAQKNAELNPSANNYGDRPDGTKKGTGFLGELKMKDGSGKVATEITIGVEFDGKETNIPVLVPTLTQKEIDYLLSGVDISKDRSAMGNAIVDKAVKHAKERISKGMSPYANSGSATTPQSSGYLNVTTLKDKSGKPVKAGVKNGKWYNIETNQPL